MRYSLTWNLTRATSSLSASGVRFSWVAASASSAPFQSLLKSGRRNPPKNVLSESIIFEWAVLFICLAGIFVRPDRSFFYIFCKK